MMAEEEQIIRRIRSLRIQGERSVIIAALTTLRNYVERNGMDAGFYDLAKLLAELRPTQAGLYNVMEMIIKEKNANIIEKLVNYFENVDKIIAEKWWKIVEDGDVIATHCHSTEEMAVLKKAKENGMEFEVVVTETRPKLQGIKSAKELSSAGIKVRYVVDSAVGFFIDEITKFMFGCDAIRKEGIYNKIGTYMMSVLAYENNKPVYFVGDMMKVDKRKEIVVEMRDAREVIDPAKIENATVLNPAFDCTPWKYVSAVLTDAGKFNNWNEISKINVKKVI